MCSPWRVCIAVLLASAARVEAQMKTNGSAALQCHAGSGNRTAFNVAVPDATDVDGLGALGCAPGYLPGLPYCAEWAMDAACPPCVADGTPACGTYGGICSEGACEWQQQRIIPAPSVSCGGADTDFVFSGCGCPSGHYFDLSYEQVSANNSISPTKCRPCDIGTYSAIGSTTTADCEACGDGQYDDDADPGTPCILCAAGFSRSVASEPSGLQWPMPSWDARTRRLGIVLSLRPRDLRPRHKRHICL
jgi:hypothetical protein